MAVSNAAGEGEKQPAGAAGTDVLRRLRFRAWRRGMREMDLLLGPFADARLDDFAQDELRAFEAMLDEPDQDLYGWLTGAAPVPPDKPLALIDRIRAFHREGDARQRDLP